MSRAKGKGTAWESAIVGYLREHGAPHAERRTLAGAQDRGDIAGVPGIVFEAKNAVAVKLAEWLDEAELERDNDQAAHGVVWFKRRGHTSPGNAFVLMSGQALVRLLAEAGYLEAPAALPQPLRAVYPMGQREVQVDPDNAIDLSNHGLLEALRGLVARYDPPPRLQIDIADLGQPMCQVCHRALATDTRGALSVCSGCADQMPVGETAQQAGAA